ncbi:hypothetical protein [Achromobacter sp. AONIH1]|uniref:hypothetical protein n=1 Tax=Achromobacter sp. AONIH1 TaxID=1758194 RepID=UPI00131A43A5|nr:hypothetical protein [Achromobacter sp. AONIH1]
MELFHTSPSEISSIGTAGRFGSFLFFSGHVYNMTAGESVVYGLEIDEAAIIEAGQLFFHADAEKLAPLVAELAHRLGVDEDDAEALIEESQSVYDVDGIEAEDAADASWDVQHYTARAAALLGFRGVAINDEQGTAYMIDMQGREGDLERV